MDKMTTHGRGSPMTMMDGMPGATMEMQTSSMFAGPEVKLGRVMMWKRDGVVMLGLTDDFLVPGAPAPHWQVVDSQGNTYLLPRLMVNGGTYHKMIAVPAYVRDVAKVQIWCAFAEVVLGEVTFPNPMR